MPPITWPLVLAGIVAVFGPAGMIYAVLNYNRDDAGKVVNQMNVVVQAMRDVNDELVATLQRTEDRCERLQQERDSAREVADRLHREVVDCQGLVKQLRVEINRLELLMGGTG